MQSLSSPARTPRRFRWALGLVALSVMVAQPLVAQPEGGPAGPTGVARLESWEAPIGSEIETIQGLVFVEWLPKQELTLILMDLPGGQRFVLSRSWSVSQGFSVLRILDDATGWWVELTERSTLRFDSTEQLGKPSLAAKKWNEGVHRVILQLKATGHPEPLTWSSSLDDPALYSSLFEQLDTEGVAAALVGAMPEETREGARALGSLLTARHEDSSLEIFDRLAELLVASLDRRGDPMPRSRWRGAEWNRASLEGQPLRKPWTEEIRSFARGFRRIPAEDPLALIRPQTAGPTHGSGVPANSGNPGKDGAP